MVVLDSIIFAVLGIVLGFILGYVVFDKSIKVKQNTDYSKDYRNVYNQKYYVKRKMLTPAIYYNGRNLDRVREFCPDIKIGENGETFIETLEGRMHFFPNYYIVRGIYGEHWAVRGDIFERTYEAVSMLTRKRSE